MALDRTTIIRGPAQIEYPAGSGNYYYSQGDIRLSVGYEVFPITNSSFGHVQDRARQRTATVSFTPIGQFLSGLWPYGTKKSGDAILSTSADSNLVIWSYRGTKITLYNVALSKMPDLILSTTKTLAGEATFTALGKGYPSIVAQDSASSFMDIVEGQGAPTDSFDPNTIITQPYSATWNTSALGFTPSNAGKSEWSSMHTVGGWHLTFDMALQPVETDEYGIVDWTVGDVRATARAQLLGVTEAQAIDTLGAGTGSGAIHAHVARGAAMDISNDLIITGAGTTITATLFACYARVVPAQFGLATLRLADMEFTATRQVVNNAVHAMFEISGTPNPF